MILRLATQDDLLPLKQMYKEVVDCMNINHINIWDEVYPCEFLEEDIKDKRLYLLSENHHILASLALSQANNGEDFIKWSNQDEKVLYIDRLAVNTHYLRKGVGSILLDKVSEFAILNHVKYLRLFVVDTNLPAIQFYLKNGFQQMEGFYDEIVDDEIVLHELGFEKKLDL